MTSRLSPLRLQGRRAIAVAFVCGSIFAFVPSARVAAEETPNVVLTEISCRNAKFCVAVGFISSFTGPRHPFVEMWDGTAWQRTVSPNVAGAFLASVSCGSATDCVAVGQRGVPPKTFAQHWDGARWTVVAAPSPSKEAQFESVSCVTAKFCVGVGWSTDGKTNVRTLVAHWNGSRWKQLASPNFPKSGAPDSQLLGVSCTSATRCFAVGTSYNPAGARDLLVSRWDGKAWSLSARQTLYGIKELRSVSCVGKTVCMAVGADLSSPGGIVKDYWNGKSWRASAKSVALFFKSVSCASATNCLAVGSRDFEAPYAERWNGTKWSRTPTPSTDMSGLESVTCLRSGSCYAVGASMLFWNGTSWSTVNDAS